MIAFGIASLAVIVLCAVIVVGATLLECMEGWE